MMMVFKRKEILVSALVLLIGVAAVANYTYEKKDDSQSVGVAANETESTDYSVAATDGETPKMMGEAQQVDGEVQQQDDYFARAKLNRESARSKKIEILNNIISSDADQTTKEQAQNDLLKTASDQDAEAVCENIMASKGFENAVVFINGAEATVTVKSENFNADSAAKIQEIVASNSEVETKNIKIVAV